MADLHTLYHLESVGDARHFDAPTEGRGTKWFLLIPVGDPG